MTSSVKAQSTNKSDYYGIIYPNKEDRVVCNECISMLNEIPMEVQYGVILQNDTLFFVINDFQYFEKMFAEKTSGIAIDIVPKSNYGCDKKPVVFKVAKGRLFPPKYQKEMFKIGRLDEHKIVYVPMGVFPKDLKPEEVEYNILFLVKKNLCHYERFWDINVHKWDLLEMGMYKDAEIKMERKTTEVVNRKVMKFTIPFEKNKFDYKPEDIQPLYDSLKLTNYNIVKLYISAYSSVEGPTDNNIRLQTNRASSIERAFEKFEGALIPTEIDATENWVEFIADVQNDPKHKFLMKQSKKEIKEKLKDKAFMLEMEPILSKHRKANVTLKLEKKSTFTRMSPPKLTSLFQEKIDSKDRAAAQEIQEILFSKIGDAVSPDSLLEGMILPHSVEFADLTLDQLTYRFNQTKDIKGTMIQLKRINKLLPHNKRVNYDLMALRIRSWAYGEELNDYSILWSDIDSLEALEVDSRLLARLRINYKIFESELLMSQRKYAEKNKALKFIYDNYKELNHTEADLLNLAKFFTGYGRHDWAIAMLENKVQELDVDEDLLFYYLNLTIINPKKVAKPFYKSIVLNATNQNQKRYCKMFDTYGYGGITFQLLDDGNLKKYHCQECQ